MNKQKAMQGRSKQQHSDDKHLHNAMPMDVQMPPDANAEMDYEGDGEDYEDGDEDEID